MAAQVSVTVQTPVAAVKEPILVVAMAQTPAVVVTAPERVRLEAALALAARAQILVARLAVAAAQAVPLAAVAQRARPVEARVVRPVVGQAAVPVVVAQVIAPQRAAAQQVWLARVCLRPCARAAKLARPQDLTFAPAIRWLQR